MGHRGTKSSWGTVGIDAANQTIVASVTAIDASFQYTPIAEFLIAPSAYAFSTVPFQAEGGNDVIVVNTNVSAATTAQTVDFPNAAQNGYGIEAIASWFYTASSTATGNIGWWDGTTRVDFDTTTAIVSYVFNMGAKGSRTLLWQDGGAAATKVNVRVVIGAPGSGASTLFTVYRAFPLR